MRSLEGAGTPKPLRRRPIRSKKPIVRSDPPRTLRLGVRHLRLPAAPRPLLVRRDRPYDATVASTDVADVLRYVAAARRRMRGPLAVEIEGPGDPLASPESVLRVLALLHEHHPEVATGIVIDGPLLSEYVEELEAFDLRYVVLRMDAATRRTARLVYEDAWYRGERLGRDGAADLALEETRRALGLARRHAIPLAVRFTLIPTVNAGEAGEVARMAAEGGAARVDVVPHAPVSWAPLARAGIPSACEIEAVRAQVNPWFGGEEGRDPTLAWLSPARTEPVDLDALEVEDVLHILPSPEVEERSATLLPHRRSLLVAVATIDGDLVDLSLTGAAALRIYAVTSRSIRPVGMRPLPADPRRRHDGVGCARDFLEALVGCRAVVATHVAPRARILLEAVGMTAVQAGGRVEEVLDRLARGTLRRVADA